MFTIQNSLSFLMLDISNFDACSYLVLRFSTLYITRINNLILSYKTRVALRLRVLAMGNSGCDKI